ncbi:phospholipid/cholesterol/gamma-HCH transport system ATP-binding protein [Halospina denitrificans]|uniref:Phospholipid/cholesterol/gamma-HCH transport system ATP-binding protein n=1 Tax=Halospina denitrificans TaxID=332522 RepID=A0A4R7K0B8_9GAMM|nr:ATP-binding cassette domain-containing protein [Halospina denitrificans]TDT43985.1 phospholipid/cholesterol/gamma-HCH transport system ATP-binding protein [Halospina denitrificans]
MMASRNRPEETVARVDRLTMAFGDTVVQRDLDFEIVPGTIFAIMGPSGCGKSTLLRHMVGLHEPAAGRVFLGGENFWGLEQHDRNRLLQQAGVLFQGGALWSSMTVAENVALPLELFTDRSPELIADQVAFKLALVGLAGASDVYPAALSGGMRKRAGLARALAMDPRVLFLDEPSAGLDPLSARRLDTLILRLRATLGVTVVMVTHELESLFAIADDSLYLDPETKTAIARGAPRDLQKQSEHDQVREFLNTRL